MSKPLKLPIPASTWASNILVRGMAMGLLAGCIHLSIVALYKKYR